MVFCYWDGDYIPPLILRLLELYETWLSAEETSSHVSECLLDLAAEMGVGLVGFLRWALEG